MRPHAPLLALAAALLVGAPPRAALAETPAAMSHAALSAALERLDEALQRLRTANIQGYDLRVERRDLLDLARSTREEAANTRRQGRSLEALLAQMDELTTQAVRLADEAVEQTTDEPIAPPPVLSSDQDPKPFLATNAFRDVAEDAGSVLGSLSKSEALHVRELQRAGEDLILTLYQVRNTDHETRLRVMKSLREVTDDLRAMHQLGLRDRRAGRPFVPAARTPQGWTDVGHAQAGLEVRRVSFRQPGTARLELRNPGEAPAPFFVELEFFDATGHQTGLASLENDWREELMPGESRWVDVPMAPSTSHFWAKTATYTVHVE